ncbi:SPW repeat domain-containing protein [Amycolatopsis jiangsuensis]|uniref:SPW repeat-containing integral membrane domain-containing protein n=1 Tax=Amycolatopsis jiangsuensis TaxID=1181879 RepID=A0A840IPD4_9PSEU|nr:SPW repeat protein [Amycolatopsis jiangsuensis]MBB4683217.1 hypothetical protein [Amycolatopsis jiangsuensis]
MSSGHDTAPRAAVGPLTGGAAGLAVLAGLYLIVGPWLARYGGAAELAVSNTVAGLAIVVFAALRLPALTWVVPVLGAWAAVSPLILRYGDETAPSDAAVTGNLIAGIVVVAAGVTLLVRRR